jgi:S-layer homology domain
MANACNDRRVLLRCPRRKALPMTWRILGLVAGLMALVVPASAAERFPDVPSTSAHADAIERAATLGVVVGYPDGRFRPGRTVTKRQICTMFQRLAPSDPDECYHEPASRGWVGRSLAGSLEEAVELGIFQGYADGSLRPERTTTRAEAATVMMRYLDADPLGIIDGS